MALCREITRRASAPPAKPFVRDYPVKGHIPFCMRQACDLLAGVGDPEQFRLTPATRAARKGAVVVALAHAQSIALLIESYQW